MDTLKMQDSEALQQIKARSRNTGGGGGAGDASAANQTLQLAQETIAAEKLTSIEAKTPSLVGGKIPVSITTNAGEKDIFGASVTTARQPQINVQFNKDFLETLVNVTSSGGASAAVTPTNGLATFSSGTGTTSYVIAQSANTVVYQSGAEVFAECTADFTTPTDPNSFQRIGLYDAANGFFVGYDGYAFGIGSRLTGVDTHVEQGDFNVDTLTGTAGSLFTRNGVVEAIDVTKVNIYRIRFGWLGIAPCFFEVLSPDGSWVTFHKILFPNTSLTTSIATPNLPVTLEISKTLSDATNLQISSACWAAGITGSQVPQAFTPAPRNSQSVVVTPAQQRLFRTTFSKVIASGVDSEYWNTIKTGTGQTISQSAGSLVLAAGTTTNSETIIRSKESFIGSFTLRAQTILSQRNANNNFFVELVDIIGDNLAVTVNSATSITVTFPNTFLVDSTFVGQSMYIGAFAGFTGVTALGGRYAIASVSGQNVTFTVASFVTGSQNTGTCSVFGWNYHQLLYNGASAALANYDTQRRGWNSGFTSVATNVTSSPGHMAILGSEDGCAFMADQLVASAATFPIAVRASRVVNIAEETTPLFLQLRSLNGNSAPTATTWTVGMISVENFSALPVNASVARAQGANTASNVNVIAPLPTGTNSIGNVGTVTTLTTLANGQTPHSSPSTGSPLRIAGRVMPTVISNQDSTLAAGDASEIAITTAMQQVIKPFTTAELDFYHPVNPVVTTTTPQSIVAASGTASVRNYVTQLSVQTDALGAAGNMFILDNQGAIGTSVTIATPGVFTSTAHDLRIGDAIIFTSLGTITGVTTNTLYYVTGTTLAATTFTVATTPGGTAIQITGSSSAFTFYRVFQQVRLSTAAITTPFTIKPINPWRGIANSNMNVYFPTSLVSGAVYLNVNGYRGF